MSHKNKGNIRAESITYCNVRLWHKADRLKRCKVRYERKADVLISLSETAKSIALKNI